MNRRRFNFGLVISTVWLLVMIGVIFYDPSVARNLKPNEWGDFFAGFFAPLAFLWLVLGYLQQGEELQLSTNALHLQAEELRNSVQQQRELVEVSRQQVEAQREAFRLERVVRQEALKPHFVIQNSGGSFSGTGAASYGLTIGNAGNTVTGVVGIVEGASCAPELFRMQLFTGEAQIGVSLDVTEPIPDTGAKLTISYCDAEGKLGDAYFRISKQHATPNSSLDFIPTND
jgi:hypothetical protein